MNNYLKYVPSNRAFNVKKAKGILYKVKNQLRFNNKLIAITVSEFIR